jgi:hypothetical protein
MIRERLAGSPECLGREANVIWTRCPTQTLSDLAQRQSIDQHELHDFCAQIADDPVRLIKDVDSFLRIDDATEDSKLVRYDLVDAINLSPSTAAASASRSFEY